MSLLKYRAVLLKFQWLAIKVGLAGTAVYYVKEQGVWRTGDESLKAYNNIKSTIDPYISQVSEQIPIELPKIPETENIWQSGLQYWNKGVQKGFYYLSNSPEYVKEWKRKGVEAALQNQEIKNFVDSLSNKKSENVK